MVRLGRHRPVRTTRSSGCWLQLGSDMGFDVWVVCDDGGKEVNCDVLTVGQLGREFGFRVAEDREHWWPLAAMRAIMGGGPRG